MALAWRKPHLRISKPQQWSFGNSYDYFVLIIEHRQLTADGTSVVNCRRFIASLVSCRRGI